MNTNVLEDIMGDESNLELEEDSKGSTQNVQHISTTSSEDKSNNQSLEGFKKEEKGVDKKQEKYQDSSHSRKHERDNERRSDKDEKRKGREHSTERDSEKTHDRERARDTDKEKEREKFPETRYFIIKSFSQKHFQISIEKGIWATQPHNESRLNDAFQKSTVLLIFSVNESRHFQGYCKMISKIGKETSNAWSHLDGGSSAPWGGVFKVQWISVHDLPFHETLHLRNPWNSDKPVKISRDGQELPSDIGSALCKLIDKKGSSEDASLGKRKLEDSSSQVENKAKESKTDNKASSDSMDDSKKRSKERRSRSRSRSPSGRPFKDHRRSHPYRSRRSPSPRRDKRGFDFLSMTYEDYLLALNRNWLPYGHQGMPMMSERDYMQYLNYLPKPGHAPTMHYDRRDKERDRERSSHYRRRSRSPSDKRK